MKDKEIKNKKVLVAVSGGVDSAVAVKLLIDQGYQVSGIFLNFWIEADGSFSENKSSSLEAQKDAEKVCLKLGIPFQTFDFSKSFKKEVVDNFLNEYSCGNTPNPCVVCNKKIKIGGLLEYAENLGFDYIATGHYIRVKKIEGKVKMLKGLDGSKDQSYFLYSLNSRQLAKILFPLGRLKKIQVRQIAKEADLIVASKSDSQEICFIPGKRHNEFLKRHLELKGGDIKLWPDGEIIGQHQGLSLYTIGQRRGIEIGGTGPYYAAKFDWVNNILYVVKDFDDPILYNLEMKVKNINWLNFKDLELPLKADIVIRYQHKPVKGIIDYNKKNNTAIIKFLKKQRAITSGQSAVFYKGSEVLGGGIII